MANLLEETSNLMPGRARKHWSLSEATHPAYSQGSPYMKFLGALYRTVKAGLPQLRGKHTASLSPADTEFTQNLTVQGFDDRGHAFPMASRFFIDGTWLAKDKPGSGGHYVQAVVGGKTLNLKGEDPERLGKQVATSVLKALKGRGIYPKSEGIERLDEYGRKVPHPGTNEPTIFLHIPIWATKLAQYLPNDPILQRRGAYKKGDKGVRIEVTEKELESLYRSLPTLKKADLSSSERRAANVLYKILAHARSTRRFDEYVAGAPGAFAVSDAEPPSFEDMKADLLDRVRNPRWEYPTWALPKVKLDEE